MSRTRITFYFDCISPYTAFAWKVLRRYRDLWNLELTAKPVLLAGIMQGSSNKPPGLVPARAQFMLHDLERNARFFEVPLLPVPLNFLSEVAKQSVLTQRLICAAQSSQITIPSTQVEVR